MRQCDIICITYNKHGAFTPQTPQNARSSADWRHSQCSPSSDPCRRLHCRTSCRCPLRRPSRRSHLSSVSTTRTTHAMHSMSSRMSPTRQPVEESCSLRRREGRWPCRSLRRRTHGRPFAAMDALLLTIAKVEEFKWSNCEQRLKECKWRKHTVGLLV